MDGDLLQKLELADLPWRGRVGHVEDPQMRPPVLAALEGDRPVPEAAHRDGVAGRVLVLEPTLFARRRAVAQIRYHQPRAPPVRIHAQRLAGSPRNTNESCGLRCSAALVFAAWSLESSTGASGFFDRKEEQLAGGDR